MSQIQKGYQYPRLVTLCSLSIGRNDWRILIYCSGLTLVMAALWIWPWAKEQETGLFIWFVLLNITLSCVDFLSEEKIKKRDNPDVCDVDNQEQSNENGNLRVIAVTIEQMAS